MFKLRPYQTDMVQRNEACWAEGVKYPVSVLPTGAGKCYRKGTLIMMADGSRKAVEDILVGDQVMGPDSLPRNVLALGRGSEMMYEVMPTKGTPYYVNESHILSLRITKVNHVITDSLGRRHHSDDVVNIGVLDYLKSNKTFKHCAKGWRVPLEFKHRDLPNDLPPYLLGLWLGDGHSRTPAITTADPEIVEYLESFSTRNGFTMRVEHQPNNKSKVYHIKSNRRVDVGVMCELRKHNLLMNKHIPEVYLVNSREQRLELLAGLLDSDGYLGRNGYYDVVFKVEKLAEDLVYLARSLGFAAYVVPCFKTCGNTGARGKYHRVSISGDISLIPTKLKRHQPAPRKQVKNVLRVGILWVRPVGVEPFYGFMLDGDHLHLLGDFTVSHNTVVASEIIRREQERDGYFAAIAHRQELVSQISLALARQGVMHDIVAPSSVRRFCGDLHNRELGRCFVSSRANGFVAGVDTLVRRDLGKLKDRVSLMFQDEAHHVLAENKWGKAAAMFPKANGLFVTATPCRADGKGLGRHADGLFDTILEGPTMREIIRMGSLTDYKIYAPPNNIDLTNVSISRTTGDYNQTQLQEASKKQRRGIVGNVVSNYLDYTPNSQAVAFVVDVATAQDTAEKFKERGVPAVALSAKNTDAERHEAITKFKAGEIKMIVNVDLLGEGFDCPAIETVIMARPTMSYNLYCQQFGRALRLLDGKQFGIVIDMVGNVKRHGLPDAPRQWSLERSSTKGGGDSARPVKVCPECTGVYEVGPSACPYCGHKAIIGGGADSDSGLIEVDAGLRELTAEELAEMRGEIDKLGKEWTASPNMSKQQYIMFSQHNKSVRSQKRLRDAIAYYAGACRTVGMDDQSIHIQFTTLYGTSITHAQTLRPKDADALSDRIEADLIAMGVDRAAG